MVCTDLVNHVRVGQQPANLVRLYQPPMSGTQAPERAGCGAC